VQVQIPPDMASAVRDPIRSQCRHARLAVVAVAALRLVGFL